MAASRGIHASVEMIMDSVGVKELNEATYLDIFRAINRMAIEKGMI